jgi:hypothetical protein
MSDVLRCWHDVLFCAWLTNSKYDFNYVVGAATNVSVEELSENK